MSERTLVMHLPDDIADWQAKEIAREVKSTIDSFTEFTAGKTTMRRDDGLVLKMDLEF